MDTGIIPTILPYTYQELEIKLRLVGGLVKRVQIDIVGKAFSSEVTVGIEELENVGSDAVFDIQLMVREPVTFLNRCDRVGADRVFGHVEYMKNKREFIEHTLALGMQAGLALDLSTPVSEIAEVIDELDAVLLMSVPAGKSGQNFDNRVLQKIKETKQLKGDMIICVDGGIRPENIGQCIEFGASEFAVGKFLWESEDIEKGIKELLGAIK